MRTGLKNSITLVVLLPAVMALLSCPAPAPRELPKTLLFSPISPEYLRDSAAAWKATGFDGFLLAGIMRNWSDDIWAMDNDSASRDKGDSTLIRIKSCNEACREHGIEDNFIKVAFYSHVPFWLDDEKWQQMNRNFHQAARFAEMSGCRGIALDIEYVSEQYDLDWEGYDYSDHSESDLREAAGKRGQDLVCSMLAAYPDMILLTLPEGINFYGPLAADLFFGMVEAMAQNRAPGGLGLLTERSYDMTGIYGLVHYAFILESQIVQQLDPACTSYWQENCFIALGGWPLGYYRKIFDRDGTFLGYGGRREKFGDEIVGSYADKSRRFSPSKFSEQYAGLLLGSRRYCWIYGHGATWWHFSPRDAAEYGAVGNSALPVDPQLEQFKSVVREKSIPQGTDSRFIQWSKLAPAQRSADYFGFVRSFEVCGPFGCEDCDHFTTPFPPEKILESRGVAALVGADSVLQWRRAIGDSSTGYLDFIDYFSPKDWVCAYALCRVTSPAALDAQIRLGSNDSAVLWFNGERILERNIERTAAMDSDILPVRLDEGENTVLIKVCNTERDWGLYLRFSDNEGAPLEGVEYWP